MNEQTLNIPFESFEDYQEFTRFAELKHRFCNEDPCICEFCEDESSQTERHITGFVGFSRDRIDFEATKKWEE